MTVPKMTLTARVLELLFLALVTATAARWPIRKRKTELTKPLRPWHTMVKLTNVIGTLGTSLRHGRLIRLTMTECRESGHTGPPRYTITDAAQERPAHEPDRPCLRIDPDRIGGL